MSLIALPPAVSLDRLTADRTPKAGDVEVYEDVIYDTVTYTAAGPASGTRLSFFNTAANLGNPALTNFVGSFQLPQNQWFAVRRWFLLPIVENTLNSAGTAAGRVRDLDRVMVTSQSGFYYNNARTNRIRGPVPLTLLGAPGAVVADFGGNFDSAADQMLEHARNSNNGGLPTNIAIFPSEQFIAYLQVQTSLAITADMALTLVGWGYRYNSI